MTKLRTVTKFGMAKSRINFKLNNILKVLFYFRSGKLPPSEHSVLNAWYEFLTSEELHEDPKFDTKVDLIIYLRTSPEMALERIKKRWDYTI